MSTVKNANNEVAQHVQTRLHIKYADAKKLTDQASKNLKLRSTGNVETSTRILLVNEAVRLFGETNADEQNAMKMAPVDASGPKKKPAKATTTTTQTVTTTTTTVTNVKTSDGKWKRVDKDSEIPDGATEVYKEVKICCTIL